MRLDTYLLRWFELSNTERYFEGMKDLIVKEQLTLVQKSWLFSFVKEPRKRLFRELRLPINTWKHMESICSALRVRSHKYSPRGRKQRLHRVTQRSPVLKV